MKKLLFTTILGLLSALGTFAQSGTTGPLTWAYSNGTLTISGNGAMPDYYLVSGGPWNYNYRESIIAVIIQEGVTSIGNDAFIGCDSLTSVTIPNSVKTIGSETFGGCVSLTSFTIPENVTSIGYSAFYGCSGLTTFNLNAINCKTMGDLFNHVFEYCSALTTLNIGETVQTIPAYAFMGCEYLNSVTIPDNVTSIGNCAFGGCSSLTTLNFNATNCTAMGHSSYPVLYGCSALTTLNIGEAVQTIPDYAFCYCKSLTSVTIPNSVTSIGGNAFSECSGLKTVNFNAVNCTVMGSGTFPRLTVFGRSKELTTLNIGEAVQTIPDYAFYGCESLISVTIPNSVTSIGDFAFSGCKSLISATIPNSVTSIGEQAFSFCSSITSVTIPNNATSIGDDAFKGCSSITSVIIPSSVTSIGEGAFSWCSKLISVTIPNSVTSIGDYAFYKCTALTKLTVKAVSPPVVAGFYTFSGVNQQTCVLEVPAGSKVKYQAAEYWKDFQTINEISSVNGTTGTLSWSLSGGTLTISGSGAMPDYSSPSYAPWYSYSSSITAVEIPEGVTSIGSYAFYGCSSLTSVTIPLSLKSAREQASWNQSSLNSVTISNGVTSIGDYAFSGCSSLASVTIPSSVTSIGEQAFSGCSSLQEVNSMNTTPPQAASNAFANINESCILYVPTGSTAPYSAATGWNAFYTIKEKELSTGALEYNATKQRIYFDGNALVIDGSTAGENVQVFNLAGVLLYTAKLQGGKTTLPLQGTGLYLVQTSSGTAKVLVK